MLRRDLGDGAYLQALEMHHAQELLEFARDSHEHLDRWLDWSARMQTLEDAELFILRGITRYAEDGLPWVGIWQDGRLAGGITFSPIEWVSDEPVSTEFGYWLAEWAGGRGLMTRAIRAMLGFVFEELKLNRVQVRVEVDNQPSRRLAERLGFTFEGIRRQDWKRPHGFVDVACYSLLAQEWLEQKEQRG